MDTKKAIAALVAVKQYLIQEKSQKFSYKPNNASIWTNSGRNAMMTNRNLMQRRAIKR